MSHSLALWPTEPDDANSRPNWRDIIEDIVAADLNTLETLLRAIQDRLGNDTFGGGASEFFATPVDGSLSLTINPGLLVTAAGTLSWIAAQTTTTLTAPATNPRIDVAALDTTTGAVSWVAGTEAASPTVPTVPAGKSGIWAVYLRVGATEIDRFGYDTGTNSYVLRDMRRALAAGGGGGSGIPATILDAKGDLIAASAADTAVRVPVGANGTFLKADSAAAGGVSWDTPAGGGGAAQPTLRLDYLLGSDITAQAINNASWGDVIANQNFTVGATTSLFAIHVQASVNVGQTANHIIGLRVNINSGGTPVTRNIGSFGVNAAGNRGRLVPVSTIWIPVSTLPAGTNTIKLQSYASGAGDDLYIRPSGQPDTEFLRIQVLEFPA